MEESGKQLVKNPLKFEERLQVVERREEIQEKDDLARKVQAMVSKKRPTRRDLDRVEVLLVIAGVC